MNSVLSLSGNSLLIQIFLCIPCLANAQDFPEPQIDPQFQDEEYLMDWESTNHEDNSTDSKTYEFSAEEGDILFFYWYVSSEENYDKLTIKLDGNTIVSSSGMNGATYTTTLTAGSHTLVVSYSKDNSYSLNNDNAGIRNIIIMDKDGFEKCIVFADANVWSICVENWDTNHDGVLSYSEAATVTDIGTVFRSSEITSFDELQYFTGLTSIGEDAFEGCSALTSIVIPNSVTSIGDNAFYQCSGLTSIEIPNSVTSIGDGAFNECRGLTSIKISNSVTSIGFGTFCNCSGLTSIEIPNSVKSIGEAAFFGCRGLTSIEIPNSVTSIDKKAFYWCTSLSSIKIPNSVTSIGDAAFFWCTSLSSIKIPNSVTSIGRDTFYNCTSLSSIKIPNSVTSIGQHAFRYCSGLTDVYCYAETVPSSKYAFDDSNYKNATLHVPACAIDDYKSTEPWSGFGSIVPLEFDLTVSDAGVATLYLDYSVAIPDVEGLGDVMYVSDVVGRSLVLTKVENNIPAHTGVIVYAQPGTYTLTSSTTHVDACENSQLSGVTQDTSTTDIDGTVYTLSVGKNQGDIGFRKFVGETLAANKAFLVMNESSEVNFYNFGFDDELTGISTTEQDVDVESAVIYDLQGRRVTSPSKGIYIVNGQKIIINNR